MNDPKRPTRKKMWTAKTKTGCITCRRRRVKCDEVWPTCNRCARGERECVYQIRQERLVQQPGQPSSPPEVHVAWKEMRVFHYLRTEGAAQISGPFDKTFWTNHLLLSAQSRPVIWYASSALAAMHKRFCITDCDATNRSIRNELFNLALALYGKSMAYFIQMCQRTESFMYDEHIVLLTASLLFMGLCNLNNMEGEALKHAISALKMVHQWHLWEELMRHGDILPLGSLIALTVRMGCQAQQIMESRTRKSLEPIVMPRLPSSSTLWSSLSEAYFDQGSLLSGLIQLTGARNTVGGIELLLHTRSKYHEAHSIWCTKFAALKSCSDGTASDSEAMIILYVRVIAIEIFLNLDLSDHETSWDDFVSECRQIVSLSKQLLHLYRDSKGETLKASFSFSTTVCDPLYFVACKCRDRTVRREAIGMLERWPRKECFWGSERASSIATVIMNLEEEGPASGDGVECDGRRPCIDALHICRNHRVVDKDQLSEDRILLIRVGDLLQNMPGREFELS